MEEPVKPALFRATSELGFFKIDSIADCFSAHSCQKELHSNTREGGGGGAVSATQKQTVIMTLWGQCVFWRSHFLPLGTRLRTWIRILNCKEMFVTSLIDSLKKKKSTHSPGTGPRCLLFITLYTLIWGKINRILERKHCVVPPIVSSGWPSWTSSVLQRELMNRWFYLLKCLLIRTDILGMKSIYFVIVKKGKKRKVQLGEFSWCFGTWNQYVDLPSCIPSSPAGSRYRPGAVHIYLGTPP